MAEFVPTVRTTFSISNNNAGAKPFSFGTGTTFGSGSAVPTSSSSSVPNKALTGKGSSNLDASIDNVRDYVWGRLITSQIMQAYTMH